jgi:hypothetical protein
VNQKRAAIGYLSCIPRTRRRPSSGECAAADRRRAGRDPEEEAAVMARVADEDKKGGT